MIGSLLLTFSFSGFAALAQAADAVKITPEMIRKISEKEARRPVLPVAEKSSPTDDPAAPFILEALEQARVKQYDKALEILREAIDEAPDSALGYYYSALVYSDMGRWGDALEYSQMAVSRQPNLAEAHFLYGLANSKLGRYEKAAIAYYDAVHYNPDDAEGYNNLGNTLVFLKEYDAAVKVYGRAVELNPSSAETYNNLGEAHRQLGRHSEAVTLYRLAVERRPGFAVAYTNMSASLVALENFQAAAEALARAVRLEPNRPEWHYNFAVIALRLNDREAATKQLSILQKLPSNPLTIRLTDIFAEYDEAVGRLLRRKEDQLTEALSRGDSETLEKLLANNYRFAGFRRVSNKAEELKSSSLLVPGAAIKSITTDDLSIKPFGNEISVRGRMMIQAVRAGEPLCGRFAYERVYKYQDKYWQITSEKVTPLYKQKVGCNSTSRYLKELRLGKR